MYEHYIKRMIDFILSLVALIILAVPLLFISGVVRIKMGNPIFFRQKRPGKYEKIFEILKFRTMLDKKDNQGKELSDDKRLTSFGRWLRSTSIDELPELINILKGDMAIVGPRPLLVKYLPLYNEEQGRRHDVRPGLTGLAQVNGRNAITWEEKFKYDIEYVKHVTFMNDCKIIFLTILRVFQKKGISSANSATMEEFKGNGHYKKRRLT